MSQSFLSVACASLLLAAGALAAGESVDVPAVLAPVAAAAAKQTATVFVTVRDAHGKVVANPAASVEAASADQAQSVGPHGVKLGVPGDVMVFVPGAMCKVTLSAKMAARGVMITVDRLESGTQCAATEVQASAGAASAASAAASAGKDRHGGDLLDANS